MEQSENCFSPLSFLILALACIVGSCGYQDRFQESQFVFVNIRNFDRTQIAHIISTVDAANPRLILLDVWFPKKSDPTSDQRLVQSLRNVNAPIIYASTFAELFLEKDERIVGKGRVNTNSIFKKSNVPEGHADTIAKIIKNKPVMTSFPIRVTYNDTISLHVSVLCAREIDNIRTQKFLNKKENIIPLKLNEKRIENYNRIDLSFENILDYGWKNVAGKVIIIGYIGPTNEDKKYTLLNDVNYQSPDTYGPFILVEIMAEILNIH